MADIANLEQDRLEEAMEEVGDLLAQLASLPSTPTSFTRRNVERSAQELAATGGTKWLEAVLHEQGWLYLDDEVSQSLYRDDPRAAALRLFELLGLRGREGDRCIESGPFGPTLTADGAALLVDRLEAAVRYGLTFIEQAEESGPKVATDAWIESWDAASMPADVPKPINAKTETKPILNLSFLAMEGRLILSPSYQRDDVWPIRRSQDLIVSILRGIPLPSVVLLHIPPRGNEPGRFEVVDGKQRLTSILRFIGKHPKALKKVAELESQFPRAGFKAAFDSDYRKFRKLWNEHFPNDKIRSEVERQFMLPFKLRTGSKLSRIERLRDCEGKYYTEIRSIEINQTRRKASEIFEHGTDYTLAVITFEGATPRQIHEVFHIYNEQTTRLNAEEIRNAVYHEVDLARALLAASESSHDIDSLLPSATTALKADLKSIRDLLDDPSIPNGRYRRSKLLGWMLAAVFSIETTSEGFSASSTANQINELLERCMSTMSSGNQPGAPVRASCLANRTELEATFAAVHAATRSLLEVQMWSPNFIDDGKGVRWQDLQFVAALGAMFISRIALGDGLEARVQSRTRAVFDATERICRPLKSQTRTQWAFIGHAICEILRALEVDQDECSRAFMERFEHDPLPALRAAQANWKPELGARRGVRAT